MRNQFFYSDSMNNGWGKAQRVSVWKLAVKDCSWIIYPPRWKWVPLGHSFLKHRWLLKSAVTWFGLHTSLLRHNSCALTLPRYFVVVVDGGLVVTVHVVGSVVPVLVVLETPAFQMLNRQKGGIADWSWFRTRSKDEIAYANEIIKTARSTDHWIPLH